MVATMPFPAEAAAVGGLDVLIPPVYEIFWSALIMLGLWLVLGKALPKIYGMIDDRREMIDAGLDAADKAKEDASLAKREREEILRKAQEEAREIRGDAQKDAGRIVAQGRHEAQAEAVELPMPPAVTLPRSALLPQYHCGRMWVLWRHSWQNASLVNSSRMWNCHSA